jgi:hypothetical protein
MYNKLLQISKPKQLFISLYVWYDPGFRAFRITGRDIVLYNHVLLEKKQMKEFHSLIKGYPHVPLYSQTYHYYIDFLMTISDGKGYLAHHLWQPDLDLFKINTYNKLKIKTHILYLSLSVWNNRLNEKRTGH